MHDDLGHHEVRAGRAQPNVRDVGQGDGDLEPVRLGERDDAPDQLQLSGDPRVSDTTLKHGAAGVRRLVQFERLGIQLPRHLCRQLRAHSRLHNRQQRLLAEHPIRRAVLESAQLRFLVEVDIGFDARVAPHI